MKPLIHFLPSCRCISKARATCATGTPSAKRRITWARRTRAAGAVVERTRCHNSRRSDGERSRTNRDWRAMRECASNRSSVGDPQGGGYAHRSGRAPSAAQGQPVAPRTRTRRAPCSGEPPPPLRGGGARGSAGGGRRNGRVLPGTGTERGCAGHADEAANEGVSSVTPRLVCREVTVSSRSHETLLRGRRKSLPSAPTRFASPCGVAAPHRTAGAVSERLLRLARASCERLGPRFFYKL